MSSTNSATFYASLFPRKLRINTDSKKNYFSINILLDVWNVFRKGYLFFTHPLIFCYARHLLFYRGALRKKSHILFESLIILLTESNSGADLLWVPLRNQSTSFGVTQGEIPPLRTHLGCEFQHWFPYFIHDFGIPRCYFSNLPLMVTWKWIG